MGYRRDIWDPKRLTAVAPRSVVAGVFGFAAVTKSVVFHGKCPADAKGQRISVSAWLGLRRQCRCLVRLRLRHHEHLETGHSRVRQWRARKKIGAEI